MPQASIGLHDLSSQIASLQPGITEEIIRVVSSSSFIGGPEVASFEKSFGSYIGASEVVGVGNGTDALEIALLSLRLDPGSEVLVPANSFISSAEAIHNIGLKPVFVDVGDDYLICPDDLVEKISSRTRAIIVVHLFGNPVDVESIRNLPGVIGLPIIEDCAQAHGARIGEQMVGTLGDIGAFSFYPGKNLGAFGDAGAISTDNPEIADLCRRVANHGRLGKFDHEIPGRNSRLDALQAAILSLKLPLLEKWNEIRIRNAGIYMEELARLDLVLPKLLPGNKHVFHQFVIRTTKRDLLRQFLLSKGIETGIHYPEAIPDTPAFLNAESLTYNSSKFATEMVSLPVGDQLGVNDIEYVCESISDFFKTGHNRPS